MLKHFPGFFRNQMHRVKESLKVNIVQCAESRIHTIKNKFSCKIPFKSQKAHPISYPRANIKVKVYLKTFSCPFCTLIWAVNLGWCHKNLFTFMIKKREKKSLWIFISNFRDIVPNYRPKLTYKKDMKKFFVTCWNGN